MEIETRMGLRVRSKYEDVVAWINSDPPGVPYPKLSQQRTLTERDERKKRKKIEENIREEKKQNRK